MSSILDQVDEFSAAESRASQYASLSNEWNKLALTANTLFLQRNIMETMPVRNDRRVAWAGELVTAVVRPVLIFRFCTIPTSPG